MIKSLVSLLFILTFMLILKVYHSQEIQQALLRQLVFHMKYTRSFPLVKRLYFNILKPK